MSVYKKLSTARVMLQKTDIKKSGHNKFAGYFYMQLQDFIPQVLTIFDELGLCGIVSYGQEMAALTIVDIETGETVSIQTPMSSANLKGAHEIQNLGAVQTYLRRYLWVTAMEICENDIVDSAEPEAPQRTRQVATSRPASRASKPAPVNIAGNDAHWQIEVNADEDTWVDILLEGANAALGFAEKPEDVVAIFRVNRNIFDKLKVEQPAVYDQLMADFKVKKESLVKE